MTTISIIGMGLSGNASFCQIVNQLSQERQLESKITIHVFETKKEHFATGPAYQVNAPAIWTLNNPAKDFKFVPETQTLNEWIRQNLANLKAQFPHMNEEYCPRAVVGLYLQAQFEIHKNKAKAFGIELVEHFEEVLEFNALEDNRWTIHTKDLDIASDFLFLCFGHVPAHHYPHLESKPGYFTVSSPLKALENIPPNATIDILGGQASAVDYANLLAFVYKHRGILTFLTRNPSIITSKGNADSCELAPLHELKQTLNKQAPQSLSFSSAKDGFWRAYQTAAKDPINHLAQPSSQQALTYQMAKYEKRALPPEFKPCGNIDELRAFARGFYNELYAVFWRALTEAGKELFLKSMYTPYMACLTGITPLNAGLLLILFNRGSLIEQSGLARIDYDEKSKEFVLHFAAGEIRRSKFLIDTSGYSYDIGQSKGSDLPFIQKAMAKGFLVATAFGGIEMTDQGQPKNRNGKTQETLFCIGPVARKCPTPYASFIAADASSKAVKLLHQRLMLDLSPKETSSSWPDGRGRANTVPYYSPLRNSFILFSSGNVLQANQEHVPYSMGKSCLGTGNC